MMGLALTHSTRAGASAMPQLCWVRWGGSVHYLHSAGWGSPLRHLLPGVRLPWQSLVGTTEVLGDAGCQRGGPHDSVAWRVGRHEQPSGAVGMATALGTLRWLWGSPSFGTVSHRPGGTGGAGGFPAAAP